MLSLEWLGWLSETIQTIGDLIPRRVQIEPSQVGIKYKYMTDVIVLPPGCHWYHPFFSKLRLESAVKQTLYLGNQIILTSDGTPIKIESSVLFEVFDFVTAVTKFNCYITQIDDDARNIICKYFSTLSYRKEIIGKTSEINEELTKMVSEKLKEYGIKVYRLQLTSIASGIPILHIDNKTNV
jgi:regulator of protease activity HflC (stomatin/prohibitin superfamily)